MGLSREVVLLLYISEIYKLDLEYLILLYDKIGEDLLFLFYLFSGKKLILPKKSKLLKIVKASDDMFRSIENEEAYVTQSSQDVKVKAVLDSMIRTHEGKKLLVVKMETPHVVPQRSKFRVIPANDRNERAAFESV